MYSTLEMAYEVEIWFSKIDPASMNVLKIFREKGWDKKVSIRIIEGSFLDLPPLTNKRPIIFVSKHKSQSKKPCFTVHFTGNFGRAEFGGEDGKLSVADAPLAKAILLNIEGRNGYETCYEVTHHGPLCNRHCFVEIGSSEEEWQDMENAEIIAKAVWEGIRYYKKEGETAIGFGGGHYAPKFSKHLEFTYGHIMPKYAFDFLSHSMVEQMIEKTFPKPRLAVIDRKGSKRRKALKELLKDFGLDVVEI